MLVLKSSHILAATILHTRVQTLVLEILKAELLKCMNFASPYLQPYFICSIRYALLQCLTLCTEFRMWNTGSEKCLSRDKHNGHFRYRFNGAPLPAPTRFSFNFINNKTQEILSMLSSHLWYTKLWPDSYRYKLTLSIPFLQEIFFSLKSRLMATSIARDIFLEDIILKHRQFHLQNFTLS